MAWQKKSTRACLLPEPACPALRAATWILSSCFWAMQFQTWRQNPHPQPHPDPRGNPDKGLPVNSSRRMSSVQACEGCWCDRDAAISLGQGQDINSALAP